MNAILLNEQEESLGVRLRRALGRWSKRLKGKPVTPDDYSKIECPRVEAWRGKDGLWTVLGVNTRNSVLPTSGVFEHPALITPVYNVIASNLTSPQMVSCLKSKDPDEIAKRFSLLSPA